MQIKHLNCGSMHPLGGALVRSPETPAHLAPMICHCLLVETEQGLVLIDTGLGTADIAAAKARLGRSFLTMVRPKLVVAETALQQIKALGYAPGDVRHIVLTHLDLDHAGGISDFPNAKVHVLAAEHDAAQARNHWKERDRYKTVQWQHTPDWALYTPRGEDWFGFDCVRQLEGLPPEILLVPLTGHTRGHAGIAVDTGDGWLLHAGDAYFNHHELHSHGPRCPAGLRLFQSLLSMDNTQRVHNQKRLQSLAAEQAGDVTIFSAHDPWEFAHHAEA